MPGFELMAVMAMLVVSGGTSSYLVGREVRRRCAEGTLVMPTVQGLKVNGS